MCLHSNNPNAKITVTIRDGTKFEEKIGVRRRWDHPGRAHVGFGSAYYDITVLELGKNDKCLHEK